MQNDYCSNISKIWEAALNEVSENYDQITRYKCVCCGNTLECCLVRQGLDIYVHSEIWWSCRTRAEASIRNSNTVEERGVTSTPLPVESMLCTFWLPLLTRSPFFVLFFLFLFCCWIKSSVEAVPRTHLLFNSCEALSLSSCTWVSILLLLCHCRFWVVVRATDPLALPSVSSWSCSEFWVG